MANKNEQHSAKVSKEAKQPKDEKKELISVGSTYPLENPDDQLKEAPTWEALAKVEVELEVRAKKLEAFSVLLDRKEEGLEKWEEELKKRAQKLVDSGKAPQEDTTYVKKLTNCFSNGTVEEYIRTSAEQFEGVTKQNFLNAVKEAAEEVLLNPKN